MHGKNILKILLIIVVIALVGVGIYFLVTNLVNQTTLNSSSAENQSATTTQTDSSTTTESIEPKSLKAETPSIIKETGWIPNWDFKEGFNSLKTNSKQFYSISPVWYELNDNGSLKSLKPSYYQEFLNYCKSNNIRVIPSIAMFDWQLFSKVLNNPTSFNRHINTIISEIDRYNFDGIDIDYESTQLADKEKFFEFLAGLSAKLKERNKIFSFAVMSQWGDDVIYSALKETRKVQEWSRMNQYVDEFRIMTYDYTSQSSPLPGPIAPIDWVESVIEYAITKIPREKIWMGIHLYSFEWKSVKFDPNVDTLNLPPTKVRASSYTYHNVLTRVAMKGAETTYYPEIAESVLEYPCQKLTCTVVYQSPEGVAARKKLASEYGIAGVAYWKIGGDGKLITDKREERKK